MPWLEIFGWTGSVVIVVSLLQTRILWLRVVNSMGCVIHIIYNSIVGVWPMVGMNTVLLAINLYYLNRLLRQRHSARSYCVSPIGLNEPLLKHVLELHELDIRKFAPGLGANMIDKAERAYLVTTGDEIVAVVLSHRGATPDTECLLVDHALPKFRDFTPGQFVYGPNGPFAQLGRQRIIAPAGMKNAVRYHAAVGFKAEGDQFVRHL